MTQYNPDCWVLIKITTDLHPTFYKVLAGWSGGYTTGDSWKMNSGITKVEDDGDYWKFIGETGSVYRCHKDGNQLRMSIIGVWNQLTAEYPDTVNLVDVGEVVQHLKT